MSGLSTDRHGRLIEPVTGSVVGFIDSTGTEQLVHPAVGTLAHMLALPGIPGMQFRTTDTLVVNGSVSPLGNEWVYDGTQWRPRGPQRIIAHTALTTGVLQTADQIIKSFAIKPGLLYLQRFLVEMSIAKTGTTDVLSQVSLRLGPAGTTADPALSQTITNVLAAGKRSTGFGVVHECTASGACIRHGSAGALDNNSYTGAFSVTAAQGSIALAGVNLQTTAQFLSLSCSMATAATDSPQVGAVFVTIMP